MTYQIEKNINTGELFKITTPNGTVYHIVIAGIGTLSGGFTNEFTLSGKTHNFGYTLNWHNCYSFGNGVESNRIRDNFNQPFLTPGARVSTIFEDYKRENRSNSLIFSGIYNSIGSVNNLNQFIQAEQITKELNPTYGSVQKLFTRDSDLVVLCEDKVLRVLGNKDAVFNADGNPQLTANQNVLGQSMPFVGEYGISKNPESFVSEAYRSYFTDKQRGVVLRLSKDGLTPISDHGMKNYFKDNLKNESLLLGGYDKKKDEYNLTMSSTQNTVTFNENVKGWPSFKSFVPEHSVGCSGDYYTFKSGKIYKHHIEDSEGQTAITGVEHADGTTGKYFFFKIEDLKKSLGVDEIPLGGLFNIKHYRAGTLLDTKRVKLWGAYGNSLFTGGSPSGNDDGSIGHGRLEPFSEANDGDWDVNDIVTGAGYENRNNFYNQPYSSTVEVLLNDAPSNIKTYNTVDYEGTEGWSVSSVKTDQSEGTVVDFEEKEGKYYNYIQGIASDISSDTDFASADIQGAGVLQETPDIDEDDGSGGLIALTNLTLKLSSINTSMQVGDILYYVKAADLTSTTADNIVKYGTIDVIDKNLNEIKVVQLNYVVSVNEFEAGDFLMFTKDKRANKASVSGYYASLNLENNSTEKAELFTVASEIQESSK